MRRYPKISSPPQPTATPPRAPSPRSATPSLGTLCSSPCFGPAPPPCPAPLGGRGPSRTPRTSGSARAPCLRCVHFYVRKKKFVRKSSYCGRISIVKSNYQEGILRYIYSKNLRECKSPVSQVCWL